MDFRRGGCQGSFAFYRVAVWLIYRIDNIGVFRLVKNVMLEKVVFGQKSFSCHGFKTNIVTS